MDNDLTNARAAIAAIDLTAENERLAELKIRIEEARTAQQEASRRIAALNGDQQQTDRLEASRVAEALLNGESGPAIDTLVRSPEARSAEKESLLGAIRELSERIVAMEQEAIGLRRQATGKVAAGTHLLADIVLKEAREQAEALVQSYAALKALAQNTDLYSAETESAQKAVSALRQDRGLVQRQSFSIEVPAEIRDALAPLVQLGEAHPAGRYGIAKTVSC